MKSPFSPEGAKYSEYFGLSGLIRILRLDQGRRAPLCYALAPGFHILRPWRLTTNNFFQRSDTHFLIAVR